MASSVLLGIAANVGMIVAGAILSRKKHTAERAFYMDCFPAYDIGPFRLPVRRGKQHGDKDPQIRKDCCTKIAEVLSHE